MRENLSKICIGCFCVLLGFCVVFTMRGIALRIAQDPFAYAKPEELQGMLLEQQQKNETLRDENAFLQRDLQKYREEYAQSSDAGKAMAGQLKRMELIAGATPLFGPGVTVMLNDSRQETGGVNEEYFIIHDTDLLRVINELKSAGAEAISINDERLISTSEIRCVGATVTINGNKYAAPYVIRAIGDAQTLENALKMPHGVADILTSWGIEVTIERKEKIEIKGYQGKQQFSYAVPAVQEGGGQE